MRGMSGRLCSRAVTTGSEDRSFVNGFLICGSGSGMTGDVSVSVSSFCALKFVVAVLVLVVVQNGAGANLLFLILLVLGPPMVRRCAERLLSTRLFRLCPSLSSMSLPNRFSKNKSSSIVTSKQKTE